MKPLVVGLGGRVLAVDPLSGAEVWRNEMLHGGLEYVSIAVSDERVIASASAGRIFCMSRDTGETIWSEKTTGIGRASLITEGKQIFICKGGHLDCFLETGQLLWSRDLRKIGRLGAALGFTDNVVQADGKAR